MDDPNINAAFQLEEDMLPSIQWILERYENCIRIAKQKTDKADVISWLEDAEYFRRVLVDLKELERLKADRPAQSGSEGGRR